MARFKKLIIKVGFPIGSLEKPTTELFCKTGMPVAFKDRMYKVIIDQADLTLIFFFMRPLRMPLSIYKGSIDVGIFGSDCVYNSVM